MCDPRDDTIDEFSSLMSGVATNLSRIDYNTSDYRTFYISLCNLCSFEEKVFKSYSFEQKWSFDTLMVETIREVSATK